MRMEGRIGELSRYSLPVLTKDLLFVSFVSSNDQFIQYVLHTVPEV
jgi:hypothetical protein